MDVLKFLRDLFFAEVLSGELEIYEDESYRDDNGVRVYKGNDSDYVFIIYVKQGQYWVYDFSDDDEEREIFDEKKFVEFMKSFVVSYRTCDIEG